MKLLFIHKHPPPLLLPTLPNQVSVIPTKSGLQNNLLTPHTAVFAFKRLFKETIHRARCAPGRITTWLDMLSTNVLGMIKSFNRLLLYLNLLLALFFAIEVWKIFTYSGPWYSVSPLYSLCPLHSVAPLNSLRLLNMHSASYHLLLLTVPPQHSPDPP